MGILQDLYALRTGKGETIRKKLELESQAERDRRRKYELELLYLKRREIELMEEMLSEQPKPQE